jgi:ribosomal protein S27AE
MADDEVEECGVEYLYKVKPGVTICPECGAEMEDYGKGWRCPKCKYYFEGMGMPSNLKEKSEREHPDIAGEYFYKIEEQAEKAKSVAEGLGYKTTLKESGDLWVLNIKSKREVSTTGEHRSVIGSPERQQVRASPIIHEAISANPDPEKMFEPIEVRSAFLPGESSTFNSQEKAAIEGFINKVPDRNDTGAINYWLDWGDRKVYLEGWIDKCLAGTGFPKMDGGEWDQKIDYMVNLTKQVLVEKAKENNLTLIEGGFREFEGGDKRWLYGVTWGVYQKPTP